MKKKFNADYEDRGSMKWLGMYLSEHTAALEAEQKNLATTTPKKHQMNSLEIATVIEKAIIKQQAVAIQLEVVDSNGLFAEDITGYIAGTDEQGFWVEQTKIFFDEIRNIQLFQPTKWSNLS